MMVALMFYFTYNVDLCSTWSLEDILKCCSVTDTDQAYYDLIVKRASTLLSTVQLNMLKFALSLRAYSATVHSFQQVILLQYY